VEQRHPRAALGLVQIRRRHHDRQPRRQELRQQLPEFTPRHRVDTGGRLVEQQDLGAVNQRARQRELLLHPARQLVGAPGAERRQLGQRQQTVPLRGIAADAMNLRLKGDVLVD
jgi:hypothetical protein